MEYEDAEDHCIPFILKNLHLHRSKYSSSGRAAPALFVGVNGMQGVGKTTLVSSEARVLLVQYQLGDSSCLYALSTLPLELLQSWRISYFRFRISFPHFSWKLLDIMISYERDPGIIPCLPLLFFWHIYKSPLYSNYVEMTLPYPPDPSIEFLNFSFPSRYQLSPKNFLRFPTKSAL